MLKRWCSIKEIEVYLLYEILTSKDTLQGKKLLRASLKTRSMKCYLHDIGAVFLHCKCFVNGCTSNTSIFIDQRLHSSLKIKLRTSYQENVVLPKTIKSVLHAIECYNVRITESSGYGTKTFHAKMKYWTCFSSPKRTVSTNRRMDVLIRKLSLSRWAIFK